MSFEIREKNGKYAIFNGDVQITEWFDDIVEDGLVEGESNYFIVRKNGKESIYQYKDGIVQKITDDFDGVWSDGLVQGQSNFFIVVENDTKFIYHKLLDKRIVDNLDKFLFEQNKELSNLPLTGGECYKKWR